MVIPTFNEAGSIAILLRRLTAAFDLAAVPFQAVVVDDGSADGTGDIVEQLAKEMPLQVLHRPGKGGLASAVLDGFNATEAELIGVMDADLSHPPEDMPRLLRALQDTQAQLAVGSRYVPGGGIQDWPMRRRIVSLVANVLARPLTPIRDATSGFFIVRREALEGVHLNPIGFKIGLEVMARAKYDAYIEVPYVFTDRKLGCSKFGRSEVLAFLRQLGTLYRTRVFARKRRSPTLTHVPRATSIPASIGRSG